MNEIKFSHFYNKLFQIEITEPVILLQTFLVNKNNLSKSFLEYDTTYLEGKYDLKGYHFVVLLFRDCRGFIFTTVRPTSKNFDKYKYYTSKIGENFRVLITENES